MNLAIPLFVSILYISSVSSSFFKGSGNPYGSGGYNPYNPYGGGGYNPYSNYGYGYGGGLSSLTRPLYAFGNPGFGGSASYAYPQNNYGYFGSSSYGSSPYGFNSGYNMNPYGYNRPYSFTPYGSYGSAYSSVYKS